LTVVGLFSQGDRFQVFDFGTSLGVTTFVVNNGTDVCGGNIECARDSAVYSHGYFFLGARDHFLTINVIQNATGTSGGVAVFNLVPEPGTMLLLSAGLVGVGLLRFRR
jgi:hypothetical protein